MLFCIFICIYFVFLCVLRIVSLGVLFEFWFVIVISCSGVKFWLNCNWLSFFFVKLLWILAVEFMWLRIVSLEVLLLLMLGKVRKLMGWSVVLNVILCVKLEGVLIDLMVVMILLVL